MSLAPFANAASDHDPAPTGPTPDAALARLVEGNKRFVAGASKHDHADEARRCETHTSGQHPVAAVLSCADSRVPVEIVFDQGIGDLFVIRVAGNVADTNEIGTIEYGVGHLNIPLVVVVGHTKCGAVTAVVDGAKVGGSLPGLLDNIAPAAEKAKSDNPHAQKLTIVNAAIRANVFQSIADLLKRSEEVRGAVKAGKVKIVGGVYDLHAGTFELIGPHPAETTLLAGEAMQNLSPAVEPAAPSAASHNIISKKGDPRAAPKSAHDTDAHAAPKSAHDVDDHAAPKSTHDAHAPAKKSSESKPKDPHGEATPTEGHEEHADAEDHAAPTTQPMTAGGGGANNWMMLGLCLAVSGAGTAAMITIMNRTKRPVPVAVAPTDPAV